MDQGSLDNKWCSCVFFSFNFFCLKNKILYSIKYNLAVFSPPPRSSSSPGSGESFRVLGTWGQHGCLTLLSSYNVFINQWSVADICHIIGICWFQMQTFCSQALNSLLTAEYLVECVTGKVRCCQEVCAVWGVCVCVWVKESVFRCVWERSGGGWGGH